MDNLKSAAQAFAALRFKDRCPSWNEYETGSPAEQRAIIERWSEIRLSQPQTDAQWAEWTAAVGRSNRAAHKSKPIQGQWWHEDYLQGDYEPSGISNTKQGELGS